MKARYIRISTPDQRLERQLVKQHPDEQLFIDICSGSIPFNERPMGKELLSFTDLTYVSVHAIDRLGRNLLDILTTLAQFDQKRIILKVDNLGIESLTTDKGKLKPNQAFKMIVTVMGQVAQMERETLLERQREGIEIAKAKGVYKGRVRGSKESKEEIMSKYPNVVKRLNEGQSLRNTAKLCDVSKGTVLKVKRLLEPTYEEVKTRLKSYFKDAKIIPLVKADDFIKKYCFSYVDENTMITYFTKIVRQELFK